MGKKRFELFSVFFTISVVILLILSGTAKAITLGVSNIEASAESASQTSFLAKVDLHTNDILLASSNFTVTMTNNAGLANYTCTFNVDGGEITSCSGISVVLYSRNWTSMGTGYGFGYGYGYNYNDSETTYESINFSASQGVGYGFGSGFGYDAYNSAVTTTAELVFNVTWTTPSIDANSDYAINFYAYVSDGQNRINYQNVNSGSITIIGQSNIDSDAASVEAVKDALTYAYILMDDTPSAQDSVLGNLYLPTAISGVDISWSSNNTARVNNSGVVSRAGTDVSVALTATLNKSTASDTKLFNLTVKAAVAAATVVDAEINVSSSEVVLTQANVVNLTDITIPVDIDDNETVYLNLAAIKSNVTNNVTLLYSNLTLERVSDLQNYSVFLPNMTTISGGSSWNGIIIMPTLREESDYTAPSGTVNVVVVFGSDIELNFSNPVAIRLGGMAGKSAAYTRTNVLTAISTACNSATAPTNINAASPRECYISSGSDLLIWTYHFTDFAAYTPAAAVEEEEEEESSGSSSRSNHPAWDIETIISNPKVVQLWSKIAAGTQTTMTITNKEIGIEYIILILKEEAKDVKMQIVRLLTKPTGVSDPASKIYRYYSFETTNLGGLDTAKIRFTVEESWITANGLTANDLAMFRYANGVWNELNTLYVSKANGIITFEATTNGFSYFAVGEKSKTSQVIAAREEIIQPPAVVQPPVEKVQPPGEKQPPVQKEEPPAPANTSPMLFIFFLLALIAACIIGVGIIVYHGKKHNQLQTTMKEHGVHHVHENTEKLDSFVANIVEHGHEETMVKKQLIKKGWDKHTVEKSFQKAKHGKPSKDEFSDKLQKMKEQLRK
ncbi:MAG: PGF-pre-PGF domain-containing protein [archaeon]